MNLIAHPASLSKMTTIFFGVKSTDIDVIIAIIPFAIVVQTYLFYLIYFYTTKKCTMLFAATTGPVLLELRILP